MPYEKVKEKFFGYGDYDLASKKKNKLAKFLITLNVVIMVVIFIIFAIYDSKHPFVSFKSEADPSFQLPFIFVYATGNASFRQLIISGCLFYTMNKGTGSGDIYGDFNDCSDIFSVTDDSQFDAIIFTPTIPISIARFGIMIPMPCPAPGSTAPFFVLVDTAVSATDDYFSRAFLDCHSWSYFGVQKEVYNNHDGTVDTQYTIGLQATVRTDSPPQVFLDFTNQVLITTEERPFGLFKRILTDAGGLITAVTLFIFGIEYIIVRIMFHEAELYYHHELREMVLWIVDPMAKRGPKNLSSVVPIAPASPPPSSPHSSISIHSSSASGAHA